MNDFEKEFWGTCVNTYGEETKQLVYAKRMKLSSYHDGRSPFNFDMRGKKVIDIGGGPVSLLLKCTGLSKGTIVDPLNFPLWIYNRYELAGLTSLPLRGEDALPRRMGHFDEAWIYNVLQHTDNPKLVIQNARGLADTVRLFEWIDLPPHPGHPHELKKELLDEWLGKTGQTEWINEAGCTGHAYYGVFH